MHTQNKITKLNIREFVDYNCKSIYEFLLTIDENYFQIIIPRDTVATTDDKDIVVPEYIAAAYSGQLLGELSTTFAYWVPSPYINDPFRFEATIMNIEKFADLLYTIIRGNDYQCTREEFFEFHNQAAEFINDAYDDKIQCCTWGLLHIANELLK